MLIARVLTALILLPSAITGILYLPVNYFAFSLALIFLFAAVEWTKISKIDRTFTFLFVFLNAFWMWLLWNYALVKPSTSLVVILSSVVFWLSSIFFIFKFPRFKYLWSDILLLKFAVGFMVLVPSWYAIVLLKSVNYIEFFNHKITGSELVLLMMIIIWIADTGAYFSGKKWGKSKLIPNVSPGKTKQGAYGAIALSCLFTATLSYVLSHNFLSSFYIILLTIFIVIISIIGDLLESMYKRNSGVKDSSQILPGHGGILDRIDSLTSVAPVFFIIVLVFSKHMQETLL